LFGVGHSHTIHPLSSLLLLLLLQVHVAEKLQVPLHMLYTIPWLPTTTMAHPWARAWGANITEYINAAAEALARPAFALLSLFAPEASRRLKAAALARVAAWANWISTPLLDHTAWWAKWIFSLSNCWVLVNVIHAAVAASATYYGRT
jgi:hypothetical protein